MPQDSAFIAVGEPARHVSGALEKKVPRGEFVEMSQGPFSQVLSMAQQGLNPASNVDCARFALAAWRATRGRQNILLGEEFPGIQFLAWDALLSRRKRRIVMLLHNVASKKRLLALAKVGLARRVDHFLCLSEHSRQVLVDQYGIPRERITVIYSRVDTTFFQPQPEQPTRRMVCSAGAVNRDYGSLIEAAVGLDAEVKIAADTAWRYSVAGKEDQETRVLPPNVEMRSWGNYLNLRQLYAESRAVVVPLARPIISGITVVLEAMAMGKPVILTRNPYVEGFVEDGVTGFCVDPAQPAQLRDRIQWVLSHPEQAEAMGRRAREKAERDFSVERYVERILSPFADVAPPLHR
ncbi:glycosyltransferase family 4 protein [Stigmatella sp. ncwal1]|uniref:Glycosyltransferase family 4 protein n=1 Tax=Stigmatella ashevillensis TaxID=2995309 RepID=A0ABT5DC20_9BACT|nr:glycosyltransferase family 4 protein [Stigmatella ashevillena]MDC0711224.1 glycosyltransferase family 4 protein [Stigmatella ashevillena]